MRLEKGERLLTATVSTNVAPVKSFSYDAIGNILSKSDVGNYAYNPPGGPLPHAVMSISGSTVSTTYTYDLNGNQTSGLGRTVTWTSTNKPATITRGARSASFLHDMDHQRFKQVSTEGTTLYLNAFGVMAELIEPGTAAARWNDYLSVGNVKVGVRFTEVATTTVTTRYFHTDHLGSIAVITSETGAVIERLSFDAWGKRRFPDGTDDPAGSIESETTRGFTGHEQLDAVGLVHMNGRVYDPMIGRMISPDPIVPDALNAQAWNRYSYVGNDPLSLTDPTGHSWLSSFFRAVARVFQQVPILRAIVQVALAAVLGPVGGVPSALGVISAAVVPAAAAISAAVVTGLSGGNLGQILRAGAIAGATAVAFNIVGDATAAIAKTPGGMDSAYAFNVAGHAGVGCLSAVASGGSCGSGALSGGISAAAGPLVGKIDGGNPFAGAAIRGAIGGLASVAGGGKFENGAVTAAFGYLFNEVDATYDRETGLLSVRDTDTGAEASGKFFSGSGFGDELPTGKYAILQRGKQDGFRLEAIDGNFGNDIHDATGRSLFRLHGPGRSIGCITACTASDWSPVKSLILNTNTGAAVVNTYKSPAIYGVEPLGRYGRYQTGVELIKKYGTLEVK